jgi:hypothetical protein
MASTSALFSIGGWPGLELDIVGDDGLPEVLTVQEFTPVCVPSHVQADVISR